MYDKRTKASVLMVPTTVCFPVRFHPSSCDVHHCCLMECALHSYRSPPLPSGPLYHLLLKQRLHSFYIFCFLLQTKYNPFVSTHCTTHACLFALRFWLITVTKTTLLHVITLVYVLPETETTVSSQLTSQLYYFHVTNISHLTNTSYFIFLGMYDPNLGQLLHRLMALYINSSFSGMSTDPQYLQVVGNKIPGFPYGLKPVFVHNFGVGGK